MQEYPRRSGRRSRSRPRSHRRHFGREPAGIWLPECGYYPGLDEFLAEAGIRYFFVDTHGVADATPRPRYGVYAPSSRPAGRPPSGATPSRRSRSGAPSTATRAIPTTASSTATSAGTSTTSTSSPTSSPTGNRKNVGIKYYRITGKGGAQGALRPVAGPRARRRARRATSCSTASGRSSTWPAHMARDEAHRGLALRRRALRALVVRGAAVHRLPGPQGGLRPAGLPAGHPGRLPPGEPGAAGGHAAALLLGRRRLRRGLARRVERLDLPPPAQGGGAHDRAGPRLPGAGRPWPGGRSTRPRASSCSPSPPTGPSS